MRLFCFTPLLVLFSCFSLALAKEATLVLPAVFTDHMVLQREMPVNIWGEASPGATISVRFAGQEKEAIADKDGHWQTQLDSMHASSKPQSLEIEQNDPAGQDQLVLKDVLVGEVWLCAGQSNMAWPVGKVGKYPGVEGGEEACSLPERAELRLFSDNDAPLWEGRGWRRCVGEDLRRFSATAYFFGEQLQRELNVPVGLINVSRGGTNIQSWTPAAFAERDPTIRYYSNIREANKEKIQAFHAAYRKGENYELEPEVFAARFFHGHGLFDRFIVPVSPYTLRGVVWYQGESNTQNQRIADGYDGMLQQLIEGWRSTWGQEKMPFYIVQLPLWDGARNEFWPNLRQSQLEASRTVDDTHLVVTLDLCEIDNLHPAQKDAVGKRIAELVLKDTYGAGGVGQGPLVSNVIKKGRQVIVDFNDGGSSLVTKGGNWRDVELSGKDGVFHSASATIKGSQAVIESNQVTDPQAIRYGWAPVFQPSLFNKEGIPASPFYEVINK